MKKIFLLIAVVMISCSDFPSEFTMPKWDVDLHLPLTQREYRLGELIKTDKYIGIDTNELSQILYKITSDRYEESFTVEEVNKNLLDGRYSFEVPTLSADTLLGLQFSSGAEIDSAFINTTNITFNVKNNSTEPMNFTLEFLGILTPQGNKLLIEGTVPANQTSSFNRDLANHSYTARFQENSDELAVKVTQEIQAVPSTLEYELVITNSNFKYMNGRIQPFPLNPIRKSSELPVTDDVAKFRDKIALHDARMDVEAIYNSVHEQIFDLQFKNLRMRGIRNTGASKSLTRLNGEEVLGDYNVPDGKLNLSFDKSNSNINEFLSFLPDSVVVTADVILNPSARKGIATDADYVSIFITVASSSKASIINFDHADNEPLLISEDDRKEIQNLNSAIIFYKVTSEVPFGMEAEIGFYNRSNELLFMKDIAINGANVLGNQIVPVVTEATIELDSLQCQLLAQTDYIRYAMLVNTTGNQENQPFFSPQSKVLLQSWLKLNYLVDLGAK